MMSRNKLFVVVFFTVAVCGWSSWRTARAADAPKPAQKRDVVYLNTTRDWSLRKVKWDRQGMLAHQLIRQAFLMAARDELGLTTRDAWLADAMPTEGDNPPLTVAALRGKDDPSAVRIWQGFGPRHDAEADETELLVQPIDLAKGNYKKFCQDMEALSRGEFVDALKKAGFSGKPNRVNPDAAVPADVERCLAEMTFTSQFQAIRELHKRIRVEGESPAILGALVRGYANLGMATELQWHPAHKVFKARALLYAQRMVVRDNKSAWALYHHAYAQALTGFHQVALEYLDEADKLSAAAESKPEDKRPSWADLIRAHCRYEVAQLDPAKADKSCAELAHLLRYVTVEQSCAEYYLDTRADTIAQDALTAMPECYRIHDRLSQNPGVGLGHVVTMANLTTMGSQLYSRLAAMPDLPPDIGKLIKPGNVGLLGRMLGGGSLDQEEEFALRGKLMTALAGLGADRGELSWATLGLLIRDETFLQVLHRADFERHSLGVSADEFLKLAAPLVADHPYREFIESHAYDSREKKKALERLSKIDPFGLDLHGGSMCRVVAQVDQAKCDMWAAGCAALMDHSVADLTMSMAWFRNVSPKNRATKLLWVSPFSPRARSVLIESDWEHHKDDASKWEKESGEHASVLVALGKSYHDKNLFNDAIRCFTAASKISPDMATYRWLADCHRKMGDEEKWRATLESFLDQPDYGLAHASVRQEIADYLMDKRQWEQALPYSLAAAETYSEWGLNSAAHCYEGLLNWELAEQYTHACAERYRGDECSWYFFCRRTGQGDLQAARTLTRKYMQDPATSPKWLENFWIGLFQLLEGETQTALKHFQQCYTKTSDSYEGMHVVLMADQLKDVKQRDATLQHMKEKGWEGAIYDTGIWRKELLVLVDLMTKDLAKGGKADFDFALVDKTAAAIDNDLRKINYYYFLAKYLDLHGKPDKAIQYWKLCLTLTVMDAQCRTLAGAELLQRGYAPDCYLTLLAEQKAKEAGGTAEKPAKTETKTETKPGDAVKKAEEPAKSPARPAAAAKDTSPEAKKPEISEKK